MKRQHFKGKKRPRSWHRSKTSSKRFYRALEQTNAAFKKAEQA